MQKVLKKKKKEKVWNSEWIEKGKIYILSNFYHSITERRISIIVL